MGFFFLFVTYLQLISGYSVVFSCWTKMLDLVQEALKATGFGVQRIDGQSSLQQRSEAIRQFNNDLDCTVMLASLGSAGEGYVYNHKC